MNHEMHSTMQFIIEKQAQTAALLQKHEERRGSFEAAFVTLTELARNADERMDISDQRTNSVEQDSRVQFESLHAYLQAQSEDFDARLAKGRDDLDALLAKGR
jgi:hypothetical protein